MNRLIVLLFCFSSMSANADLIFQNAFDAELLDAGGFSQFNQILAAEFVLDESADIDRATWNGSMFSKDPLDTGDAWVFDVVFLNAINGMPGDIISQTSVLASVTDTGTNILSERSYVFDASFSTLSLDMGSSYFISVINTGDQNTFRWNLGQEDLYGGYQTRNIAHGWDDLGLRSALSFSLYSTTVSAPEPTSYALLGLGLLAVYLSRKRLKN